MLELLEQLEAAFVNQNVWAMTSMLNLLLQTTDRENGPWPVKIALGYDSFLIDYRMPESEAPWPDARVTGEAWDVSSAVEMTIVAMNKSGSWTI